VPGYSSFIGLGVLSHQPCVIEGSQVGKRLEDDDLSATLAGIDVF